MLTTANGFQLETHPVVRTEALAALTPKDNRSFSIKADFSIAGYKVVSSTSDVSRSVPAELAFPKFGYSLPCVMKFVWSAATRSLTLRIELSEGVILVCQLTGSPIENEKIIVRDGSVGITIVSSRPCAHFVASTFQLLSLLDQGATLRAADLQLSANVHFVDTLKTVGDFLLMRHIADRLMVIEKAFDQEFSIPQFISGAERSVVDFVYYAITERSFAWPFWQESFPLHADALACKLLLELNGTNPFNFETSCFQQGLLGRTLNLGKTSITVQNAALVNLDEVKRELQQLDEHSFQAVIKSLSGTANYEFLGAPRLFNSSWDEPIEQLIKLEGQLVELYFEAVNQLAANSIDEETALEQESLLSDLAFDFSNDDDSASASKE